MSKFELIDDYLTNRLSESEAKSFEASMESDPALKSEVESQRFIVEGIRKARAIELKSMLNQVPVETVSLWGENVLLKVAAVIGVAGVIGTAMYFYGSDSQAPIISTPSAEVKTDSLIPKGDQTNETITVETEEPKEEGSASNNETTVTKRASKPRIKESKSPKLDVNNPSNEMLTNDSETESSLVSNNMGISMSTIQVERDSENKLYNFHYQFWESKLFLFGPFDESLYEILEIHGDHHALFLYFKDNFYLLNDSTSDITELTPIRDRTLTQKLKEFRSSK